MNSYYLQYFFPLKSEDCLVLKEGKKKKEAKEKNTNLHV